MCTCEKSDVTHFKVFGCRTYAHIPKQKRQKLDSESKESIFIGYTDRMKGYKLLRRKKKTIFHSKDVVFDETWGKVHNQERNFQSSSDVSQVDVDEFTMQSQEEGEDSIVEDATNCIVKDAKEGITNHEEPILEACSTKVTEGEESS
jgi:hypothetical protein